MIKKVINFDDKQPFEDTPTKNSVSKDKQTQINEVEGPSNPKPVKKNFDEIIEQFQRALQCSTNNKMQNVPSNNVTTSDEAAENKSYHFDYNTQDNIDQREKFTESSVVSSNADDGAVLCFVDSNYTNNKKDENETAYGESLSKHEQIDVDVSANVATFTNFNDSFDEETTPKKSKQFTFTDSDLPNSDEIREILMMYPKPPSSDMSEGFEILSNSESCSEDESEQPICRRRHKPENTKIDFIKMFEVLPVRIITRKRKQPERYGFEIDKMTSTVLKPRYLTKQEDQISAEIIIENVKRVIKMQKRYTDKDSQNQKSVKEKKKEHSYRKKAVNKSNQGKTNLKVKTVNTKRKNVKSKLKLNSRKNAELKIKGTKEHCFNSISAAETTSRTTRSTKNKNHIEMTQNNRIILRNRNNKTECKPTDKKVRARLTENKVRRSKRQLKAKEISGDTTAPISILKKRIHEPQSSSTESPKSLKRSVVDKSNVSNPKRMRLRNTNDNQEIDNKTSRASKELQLDRRVPYVYLLRYQPTQKVKILNSNSNLLKMRTRRQSARRSVQMNKGRKK